MMMKGSWSHTILVGNTSRRTGILRLNKAPDKRLSDTAFVSDRYAGQHARLPADRALAGGRCGREPQRVQWRNRTQDARWAFAIETAVQNSKAYCYLLFHTESGFTSAVVATDRYVMSLCIFCPGAKRTWLEETI